MDILPKDIENLILEYKNQIEHYEKFQLTLDKIKNITYTINNNITTRDYDIQYRFNNYMTNKNYNLVRRNDNHSYMNYISESFTVSRRIAYTGITQFDFIITQIIDTKKNIDFVLFNNKKYTFFWETYITMTGDYLN